jgi:Flp pilus assembly protein TadG
MGVRTIPAMIARLRRDIRGVSAIEFALIAPILILIYCGMAELSSGLTAARKASHAASAVGDLVSQQSSVSLSTMANFFLGGDDVMQPFPTSATSGSTTTLLLQQRITSAVLQSDLKTVLVSWSCTPTGQSVLTPLAVNATLVASSGTASSSNYTSLSSLLVNAGDSVIITEGRYTFSSPVNYMLPQSLVFTNTYFLKPRRGASVATPGTGTSGGTQCNG